MEYMYIHLDLYLFLYVSKDTEEYEVMPILSNPQGKKGKRIEEKDKETGR